MFNDDFNEFLLEKLTEFHWITKRNEMLNFDQFSRSTDRFQSVKMFVNEPLSFFVCESRILKLDFFLNIEKKNSKNPSLSFLFWMNKILFDHVCRLEFEFEFD